MKLITKNGRLLKKHDTSLNKEQIVRFNDALHWYEKAVDKISKRYDKGKKKDGNIYAMAVAKAADFSVAIDRSYREVLDGNATIGEFKEAIRTWFTMVREGMDKADIEK
jgi:hypothetical protein